MNIEELILQDVEKWETRELGSDKNHVELSDESALSTLNDALNLTSVSIDLDKELLANLMLIAAFQEIGIRPLIRDLLVRFVDSEMKQMAIAFAEQKKAGETSPTNIQLSKPELAA